MLLAAYSKSWIGDTIVICLQETALVRIYSKVFITLFVCKEYFIDNRSTGGHQLIHLSLKLLLNKTVNSVLIAEDRRRDSNTHIWGIITSQRLSIVANYRKKYCLPFHRIWRMEMESSTPCCYSSLRTCALKLICCLLWEPSSSLCGSIHWGRVPCTVRKSPAHYIQTHRVKK